MPEASNRDSSEVQFSFLAGQTDSSVDIDLSGGCFGSFIVPTGSELIGKTLQIVAVSRAQAAKFSPTELLSTPITLAAGANALSQDQIREAGAVSKCRLRINSAVVSAASLVLLWKS